MEPGREKVFGGRSQGCCLKLPTVVVVEWGSGRVGGGLSGNNRSCRFAETGD